MMLVVTGLFGFEQINKQNVEILKLFLGLKSSLGVIGGVQNQAYYIIGVHEESLIIMDPHKVNVSDFIKLKFLTFRTSIRQNRSRNKVIDPIRTSIC